MSRYVEKEAFIALLNKRIYCLCGGETVKETRNVRDMLEVFPTADVKPVARAEWLDGRCTNCAWELPDYEYYGGCEIENISCDEFNFCPNCGAEMRMEKDDER